MLQMTFNGLRQYNSMHSLMSYKVIKLSLTDTINAASLQNIRFLHL